MELKRITIRIMLCSLIANVLNVMSLRAQEPYPGIVQTDSLRISTLQFNRTLETFLWNGRIIVEPRIADGAMSVEQLLNSRAIRVGRMSIQDEWRTNLLYTRNLTGSWGAVAAARSMGVSGNRQLDLGNLSDHQLLAGPRYSMPSGVLLSFLGGFAFASQEGIQENGFSYLAEARARSIPLEDFLVSFASRSGQSFLSPRTVKAESIMVSIVRDFEGFAMNNLSAGFSNHRREFYLLADPAVRGDFAIERNIFRRDAREISISDSLSYRASARSSFIVHVGFMNRTIDRGYRYKSFSNPGSMILDSKIQELRVFGGASVRLSLAEWLRSEVALMYEEREERHSVKDEPNVPFGTYQRQDQAARRLGNLSRRTGVAANLSIKASEKDSLNLTGSASILRYDTPDSINTDDRDELLLAFGVKESHSFNPHLSASVLAEATLSHLVYLHRFQSANNNWNRVLRFQPRVDYAPTGWLTTVNTAEVLVNYTVYDFEDQIQSVRSFSFRQAAWSDSTSLRIGKRIQMTFQGGVRIYERGVLKWKEFKERPEHYFVEKSYWPQVTIGVTDFVVLGTGYRFFSQARYRYEGRTRHFERRVSSVGPTAALAWSGHHGRSVSIEGWRETQSDEQGGARTFSNLSITVGMAL